MKRLFTTLAVITIVMLSCKKDKKGLAAITTSAVTNVTSNSVTTGGNITDDGNSGITKRGIVWATHTAPTVSDSMTTDGSGKGSFTSNVTGLNANTTYYIRAYAVNASGTAYGNEVSFKTNAGVATVTTTAISNIQPLSAASGGEVTNDGGASITERGVVYSTTPNPTTNNYKIVASLGTGIGTYSATLSPLANQQTYYVRAYAINSYGTAYGKQVQFNAASANTVVDVDGNVYQYVTVCNKSWMASNLKTTRYRNGDTIVNGYTSTSYAWLDNHTGAYTFPNGDPSKNDLYGKLYSVPAVQDSRGVCPTGWHVPTDDEWKAIEMCQGMTQAEVDGTGLRGTVGAKFLENGTAGLNLQLSGYFNGATGSFQKFGIYGVFWSSTTFDVGSPVYSNWYRAFNVSGTGPIYRQQTNGWASSVRCVKD